MKILIGLGLSAAVLAAESLFRLAVGGRNSGAPPIPSNSGSKKIHQKSPKIADVDSMYVNIYRNTGQYRHSERLNRPLPVKQIVARMRVRAGSSFVQGNRTTRRRRLDGFLAMNGQVIYDRI